MKNKDSSDTIFSSPQPVIFINVVVFTIYKNKLCLVVHTKEVDGKMYYVLPGGLMKKGISIIENSEQFLHNQTGITGIYKEQLHVFGEPDRDPRAVTISYLGLVNADDFLKDSDFTKIQILEYDKVESNKTPFLYDHKKIIRHAKDVLEYKLEYTSIIKHLVNKAFTIPQLHKIYEILLGEEIDDRNFRKKVLQLNVVRETGKSDKKSSNKPAKLYEFVPKASDKIGLI